MIEDDQTVETMRASTTQGTRTFMTPAELRLSRMTILRVTQAKLAEQLINPSTGKALTSGAICRWEAGRPIPLWAARRIRDLEEAARRYDARKKGE